MPPCTPKGALNPGSLFYFVLPESGTCLPLWGRWPGGAGSEGVSFRGNPTPVSAAASVGPKRCPPGTRTPSHPRFRRKAGAFLQSGRFRWLRCYPPPAPSRKGNERRRMDCLYGRGSFFSKNKVFSGGSAPSPPRACLALVHRFILCFLEARLASPFGGGVMAGR